VFYFVMIVLWLSGAAGFYVKKDGMVDSGWAGGWALLFWPLLLFAILGAWTANKLDEGFL